MVNHQQRLLIFARFIYTLLYCRCINKFNHSIQIPFSGSFIKSYNCISTNLNHRGHLIQGIVLITLKLINLKYIVHVSKLHNFIFFMNCTDVFAKKAILAKESRSNVKCSLRNRKWGEDSIVQCKIKG